MLQESAWGGGEETVVDECRYCFCMAIVYGAYMATGVYMLYCIATVQLYLLLYSYNCCTATVYLVVVYWLYIYCCIPGTGLL